MHRTGILAALAADNYPIDVIQPFSLKAGAPKEGFQAQADPWQAETLLKIDQTGNVPVRLALVGDGEHQADVAGPVVEPCRRHHLGDVRAALGEEDDAQTNGVSRFGE
ncbi:hypothetical protein D3C80_1651980 [compost metagenome]